MTLVAICLAIHQCMHLSGMQGDTIRLPIWKSWTKNDTFRSTMWKVCKNWYVQISDLNTPDPDPVAMTAWVCSGTSASKIMGSRPWPFGVTWCHLSRDHSTPSGRLPMSGPKWPRVYLSPLSR